MLLMTGCQSDEIVAEKPTQEDGKRTITFSMNIPDFQVKSRAESETPITKIDLMLFDANKEYIETIQASSITVDIKEVGLEPKGEFTATIDPATTTIHFIANYDGNLPAKPGQKENEVIPNLTADADNIVYWARTTGITAETTAIEITFLRHLAKVTVQVSDEIVDEYAASSYFKVTDFVLCNYANLGTIAPSGYEWGYNKNPETITEVTDIDNHLTNGTEHSELPKELYLAEYENKELPEDQTYVILVGQLKPKDENGNWDTNNVNWGDKKYYKVLLTDENDKPFKIIRNVNYKIVVKQMQDVGSSNLTDAMEANPINNLYAYVMPESPSISDMDDNTLTVTPIVHLITGDSKSRMITSTVTISGTLTDDIKIETLGDSNILPDASNITINEGKLSVEVAEVDEIKKAQIIVKWGKLSRTITVIASPQYTITAQAYDKDNNIKSSYSGVDEDVYFRFYLDENYPAATDYPDLYPIKCYIRADNLYPVDNKDMLIDYEYKEGQYWYTYLADKTGDHTIHFKTKLSGVNEKIEVESEYFGHSEVSLTYQELKRFTNISWTNLDRYGSRNDGTFSFRTENANDKVTVTIKEGDTVIYSDTHTGSTTYTISTLGLTTWGNQVTVTLGGVGYIPKTTSIERNKLVIPAGKITGNTKNKALEVYTSDPGDDNSPSNGFDNNMSFAQQKNSAWEVTKTGLTSETNLYFRYSETSYIIFKTYYVSGPHKLSDILNNGITLNLKEQ